MSNEECERSKLFDELQDLRARVEELESERSSLSECKESFPLDNVKNDISDDYLRCLIKAIPDLVWLKNSQGVYLSCNEAFELFFGAKESEIVGKTDYDFVDQDLADFFRSQDKRAMMADKPCANEECLTIAATGKRILVETIKTPIKTETGILIGILGIARDITERKQIEDVLEKRVTFLTSPLDSSSGVAFEDLFNIEDIQRLQDEFSDATGVASVITLPDGSPITKPSNFCRLCNEIIRKTEKGRANCYKSDAALGILKNDGPTIRPCMSGGLWDAGAGISVGGRHVANWLIGQVRDEKQSEETIRAYAREIGADEHEAAKAFSEIPSMPREQFNKVSKVLFTLATQLSSIAYQNVQQARFINDLRVTEAELAKTRKYLSNIIDSMPSLLVGVDTECRVTQWNMEAERDTGLSVKDALGQPLGKVLPSMATEIGRIEEAIRTRTPLTDSLQTKISGGAVLYENITVYPLISDGVEGAVVRIDDVTNRIKMELMMVQSEKMISVGELAAGMAHEINNPLAGVLGNALNIKRRIFGDIKKNEIVAEECGVSLEGVRNYLTRRGVAKMLDGIHESGSRAATIVLNMLSFSRKSENKLEYNDIIEILDNTLELAANDYNLKKHYDFKRIKIVREYDDSTSPVFCEKTEIQQVFLNLLKNGAEAMTDKVYTDDSQCFVCRVKPLGEVVSIEIEDNGPGIDEITRKRLFEPFYTTKDVGHGTGLGLSVSYFIVTNHHRGSLEVDSVLGEWTRFTIKLPISKGKRNVAEERD